MNCVYTWEQKSILQFPPLRRIVPWHDSIEGCKFYVWIYYNATIFYVWICYNKESIYIWIYYNILSFYVWICYKNF